MANERYSRELSGERIVCPACSGSGHNLQGFRCETCAGTGTVARAHRFAWIRSNLLAALVLTAAGVVLVWLFMFLVSQG